MLLVEIAMFIAGIYVIATAKLPSLVVGSGSRQIEGSAARLFGALLLLPIPIVFVGSAVLAVLFGEESSGYAGIFELLVVLAVAIVAVVLARVVGKPVEVVMSATSDTEAKIAKKSQGAFIYAVLSFMGLVGLICGPLAIHYANQALNMIDENHIGEQHRSKAKNARTLAIIVTVLWWGVVLVLALLTLFAALR